MADKTFGVSNTAKQTSKSPKNRSTKKSKRSSSHKKHYLHKNPLLKNPTLANSEADANSNVLKIGKAIGNVSQDIINLTEEIEIWSKDFYEKINKTALEKTMRMKLPFSDLKMVVDTTNLHIETDEPEYKSGEGLGGGSTRNNVLYKTSYINATSNDLDYVLSTTRTTKSVCKVTITKGFVSSSTQGLSIALPKGLVQMGGEMSKSMHLYDTKEQSVERENKWSIQTNFKVPAKKTVNAQLVVKESEFNGTFHTITRFKGSIGIQLFKGTTKVSTMRCRELRDIFKECKGFCWDSVNKCLFLKSEGQCYSQGGVEQFIIVSEINSTKTPGLDVTLTPSAPPNT